MKKFIAALMLALPFTVQAADPVFNNITDADMKEIAKGMGANFTHNSMMGASKMGTVFGFQFGLVAAQTAVPDIDDIAKRNSGELPNLYNAGLMAAVGIPFGLAFEATMMPKFKGGGASASANSFAVKMNFNEVIPVLPINLALRGVYSNAELSFDQDMGGGVTGKVKNETSVSGVQLLLSPMIPIVEPYIGVGTLSAENKLGVSTGSILVGGVDDKKKVTSTQILAGVEANLLLMKLGLEYSQAFDNTRYGFKLSFGF